MAIIQLLGLQNDYGSYRGNTLTGRSGSVANVPNNGLGGILGRNLPHLSGLIINIDGVGYTDSSYLNGLKASGNPYLSKNTLPTIEVTLGGLNAEFAKEYAWEDPELSDKSTMEIFAENRNAEGKKMERLDYAEAIVVTKLNTVDDYLNYFNDFFNPTRTEVLLPSKQKILTNGRPNGGIGNWILMSEHYNTKDGPAEAIRTGYAPELDERGDYPGMKFMPFDDMRAEADTDEIKVITPPVPDPEPDPEPVVVTVEPQPEIEIAIDVQDLTPYMGVVDTIPIIVDSNPFTGATTGGVTVTPASTGGGGGNRFNNFGGSYGGDPINRPNIENAL